MTEQGDRLRELTDDLAASYKREDWYRAQWQRAEADLRQMRPALEQFACVNQWSANWDGDRYEYTFIGDEYPSHIAQRALGNVNGEGCGCESCRYFGGALGLDAPPDRLHNPGNPGRGGAVGEGGDGTDGATEDRPRSGVGQEVD